MSKKNTKKSLFVTSIITILIIFLSCSDGKVEPNTDLVQKNQDNSEKELVKEKKPVVNKEITVEKAGELIANATALSQSGKSEEVIEMLDVIFESTGAANNQLFEAHLLVAMQYLRYKEFEFFKEHVLEAEKYVNDVTLKFYLSQFENFKEIVEKGTF